MIQPKKPHGNTGRKRDPAFMPRKPKRYTEEEIKQRNLDQKKQKVQWFVSIPPELKKQIDEMKIETGLKLNEEFVEWLLERGRRSLGRSGGRLN